MNAYRWLCGDNPAPKRAFLWEKTRVPLSFDLPGPHIKATGVKCGGSSQLVSGRTTWKNDRLFTFQMAGVVRTKLKNPCKAPGRKPRA